MVKRGRRGRGTEGERSGVEEREKGGRREYECG
jgi:hypothetical protein